MPLEQVQPVPAPVNAEFTATPADVFGMSVPTATPAPSFFNGYEVTVADMVPWANGGAGVFAGGLAGAATGNPYLGTAVGVGVAGGLDTLSANGGAGYSAIGSAIGSTFSGPAQTPNYADMYGGAPN